ncbi:LA_2272 family surface repeat-containing protein [Thaumasiovibrio sp. DFM-14]|uniref:LA_2272 family surface repeat-containing protein n=1 Tax=Thaumasiovibrio sp. DFM-14 TaxID=3384792 RepID=UPI00399F036C
MKKHLPALILLSAVSAHTFANQPAQLSLPGMNLPDGNVKGVRATLLYGQTPQVTGLNLTLIGLSETQQFSGLNIDFFGANRVTQSSTGLKLGLANWNDNVAKGVDIGFLNYTGGMFHGLQWGAVNYAGSLKGLQFGLFNATNRIEKGVQLGFINYDASGTFVSENLPVFPIINARF